LRLLFARQYCHSALTDEKQAAATASRSFAGHHHFAIFPGNSRTVSAPSISIHAAKSNPPALPKRYHWVVVTGTGILSTGVFQVVLLEENDGTPAPKGDGQRTGGRVLLSGSDGRASAPTDPSLAGTRDCDIWRKTCAATELPVASCRADQNDGFPLLLHEDPA